MSKEVDNIFENLDFLDNENSIKMTKDEFILKTKEVLNLIMKTWSESWQMPEPIEGDVKLCDRCNGFLYVEQGGDIVECPSCDGTGSDNERVFNAEDFLEALEHEIIFGESTFLDLLECEIKEEGDSKG